MLPSRGLRLSQQLRIAGNRAPWAPVASRSISTQRSIDTRPSIRWQLTGLSRNATALRVQPGPIAGLSAVRFASSTSASTVQTYSTTDAVSSATASSSELLSDPAPIMTSTPLDSLEFSNMGAANITEHVGYLKELGLNFGWGPTSIMQWYYEHVHILSGLPWWSSILLASFLYRVFVLAYPNLLASDQMARMKSVAPYMKKMQMGQRESVRKGDQMAMMQQQREIMLLKQSAGISFTKQFSLIAIQTFFGYGTFKLMREMAQLPVPGLESQGIAWIHDLTVPDPYYILPLALAGTMHLVFKLNQSGGGASELTPPSADMAAVTGHLRPLILYGMPAMIGVFMLWMPACLQLSFASTSIFGMMQGRLMLKPWFRQGMGLWPMENAPPPLFGSAETAHAGAANKMQRNAPRNLLTTDTMAGYQAPTVADIARATPSYSKPRRGLFGTLMRPFSPIVRYMSGLVKEVSDMMARRRGSKDAAKDAFEEKARVHERRRRKELEEDRLYRERMTKQHSR